MIKALKGLTVRQWFSLSITVAIGVVVELGLRTLRLPTLTRVLRIRMADDTQHAAATRLQPAEGALSPRARRRLIMVYRVMRHWPWDEKCLRRSLVGAVRIREYQPTLVIGVTIIGDDVKAHAWLRVNGLDLDPAAQDFQPLLAAHEQ